MATPTHRDHAKAGEQRNPPVTARLAVGVDGYPEGRDAAALGAAISRATGAATMLVAVHPDRSSPATGRDELDQPPQAGEDALIEIREAFAPEARLAVRTDQSVGGRCIGSSRSKTDLLMGSSRNAAPGHARIGKRTRQLLCHFECALAVAPRGLHAHAISASSASASATTTPRSRAPRSPGRAPWPSPPAPSCTCTVSSTTGCRRSAAGRSLDRRHDEQLEGGRTKRREQIPQPARGCGREGNPGAERDDRCGLRSGRLVDALPGPLRQPSI